MAVRSFWKTKSGVPTRRRCQRNPRIFSRRKRLASASSVVLFPRGLIRRIRSECSALVRMSGVLLSAPETHFRYLRRASRLSLVAPVEARAELGRTGSMVEALSFTAQRDQVKGVQE